MRNILVATDGSASATRAVAEGVKLARQANAEIVFLNVVEPGHINQAYRQMAEAEVGATILAPTHLSLLDAFPGLNSIQAAMAVETHSQEVARLVSDRVLDDAVRTASQAGVVNVRKLSTAGDPTSEIVKTAAREGVDLVVLGRRGLSEVAELLLGSISQKVLHRVGTNVLVVT